MCKKVKNFILGLMIIGVKESTFLNKIFTSIKVLILLFIIICGTTKVNVDNWRINTNVNKQD